MEHFLEADEPLSRLATKCETNDKIPNEATDIEQEQAEGYLKDADISDDKAVGDVESVNAPGCLRADNRWQSYECLKPLLLSMKVCGLFYECRPNSDEVPSSDVISGHQTNDYYRDHSWRSLHVVIVNLLITSTARLFRFVTVQSGKQPVYPVLVVLFLWINDIRFFSAFFTGCDVFGQHLIHKVSTFIWMLLCAILQTTYFVACRSGRLHSVLDVIRPTSSSAMSFVHRRIVACVTTCWTVAGMNWCFSYTFCSSVMGYLISL
jgi:hypothetical protein